MGNINDKQDEGIKLDEESIDEGQVTSIAQEEKVETAPQEAARIKLGEKEYSPEELAKLVQLGSTAAEMEDKYHTSFDKAWSAYGKTANENTRLKNENETLRKNQTNQSNNDTGTNADEIKAAREAARKLGIILDEDVEAKIASKFEDLYQARKEQDRIAQQLLVEGAEYEKKFDGKDGRPVFRTGDVMRYMQEQYEVNPKRDLTLERAYREMHADQIEAWRDSRYEAMKKPGVATTQGSSAGASKQPNDVKVTKDNIEALVREELWKD